MIRTAKNIDEVHAVATFMTRFEQATSFVKVNVAHTVEAYWELISKDIAVFFILEEEGQMIGGMGALKYPDIHDGKLTAVETFWFVTPEKRGKGMELFKAFEDWAIANNCTKLAMIHLADSYPDVLEKIYIRKGYKLVEKHYVKEIQP